MGEVGPGQVIDPVRLTPPRVSLLSSVDVTELGELGPTDALYGWENGVRWLPEKCGPDDNPYWWACPDSGGAAPGFSKTVDDPPSQVAYRPFDVWVGVRCGNQPPRGNRYWEQARDALLAFQSHLLAQELWTGAYVATPASFDNDFLENSPTALNGGANTPYVTALAELEQALSTCQPGQVGVIHAQPRTVTLWVQNGLVTPEASGRRLRTAFGTIVVPDSGYDGGGTGLATGGVASSWAYGTGMVRVLLGPIRRLTTEADANDGVMHGLNDAEIERSQNSVIVRAERTVAAVWDECCHVGVRVNHTAAL